MTDDKLLELCTAHLQTNYPSSECAEDAKRGNFFWTDRAGLIAFAQAIRQLWLTEGRTEVNLNPKVISDELLDEVIKYVERSEVKIDGEWGTRRTLAQLEKDQELPDLLYQLRQLRALRRS